MYIFWGTVAVAWGWLVVCVLFLPEAAVQDQARKAVAAEVVDVEVADKFFGHPASFSGNHGNVSWHGTLDFLKV